MKKVGEEVRELLFTRWKDLHGKKRYISPPLAGILSVICVMAYIYVRDQMSYQIYQLFVVVLLSLFMFLIALSLKYEKTEEGNKTKKV